MIYHIRRLKFCKHGTSVSGNSLLVQCSSVLVETLDSVDALHHEIEYIHILDGTGFSKKTVAFLQHGIGIVRL